MDGLELHRARLSAWTDPARSFPPDSELAVLDELGRDLPSLLNRPDFRQYAGELEIPHWPETLAGKETLPLLRLYYVRLAFLASAYVNQISQPPARLLPRNIAVPLWKACRLLNRPPGGSSAPCGIYKDRSGSAGGQHT